MLNTVPRATSKIYHAAECALCQAGRRLGLLLLSSSRSSFSESDSELACSELTSAELAGCRLEPGAVSQAAAPHSLPAAHLPVWHVWHVRLKTRSE